MKPISIDKEVWYNDPFNGHRYKARIVGVLENGAYVQTERKALVSGRLIREFATWDMLEEIN